MKIAIINLTGGRMCGGYRKYLINVIPRMAANPCVEAILCASPESVNVQDWFEPFCNVKFVNCKPFRFLHHNHDSKLHHHLEDFRPDVIFVPVERSFQFNKVPVVRMLQNMESFVGSIEGNPFTERLRLWSQNIHGRRSIIKSSRMIAISEFVRDFLITDCKLSEDLIGLVYHGIDLPESIDCQRPSQIPESWGGQFLFTAGSIRPARGLEDAVYAMNYLCNRGLNISGLVIAGSTSSRVGNYKEKLLNWLKEHDMVNKVCWTGALNEKEMAWCYDSCKIFVMTSRVEACPNIALEAISHGCICIAADNPPLPEIFHDAAVYYPPTDGESLAKIIETVLSWDDNQRNAMSEKAKRRAAEVSWDVCADKTVAELEKAIRGADPRASQETQGACTLRLREAQSGPVPCSGAPGATGQGAGRSQRRDSRRRQSPGIKGLNGWKKPDDGRWVPPRKPELCQALRELLDKSESQRKAMGYRGRRLVLENYNWDKIARQLLTVYNCILQGKDIPLHPEAMDLNIE
jgi:glycosyltransferase involved in cell wall biosynthesis